MAGLGLLGVFAGAGPSSGEAQSRPAALPKNVIVMINDGAGWGTWDAAAYWQYGSRAGLPYANFPVRYGMTTFPLNPEEAPTYDRISRVGYDAARAWDRSRTDSEVLPFAAYEYLNTTPTDSAASGTALSAGIKTYNSAINYDNYGQPVDYTTLVARRTGRATGVVTSVPFSHATPAAFAAQNHSRNNYLGIAHQMLTQGHLDLIMGTGGARGFDIDGVPYPEMSEAVWAAVRADYVHHVVTDEEWAQLEAGTLVPAGSEHAWQLIRSKADFEALADGRLRPAGPLIGVPEVSTTLQCGRRAEVVGYDAANPSGVAYIPTVPTLATMTRGALRHLARCSDVGFFVMIEGGATDWAAHSSSLPQPEYGRLIEETLDFNDAVSAVIEWVEANSSWEETLLIITTDHDNSMPFGPDAQTEPFQAIVNNGKGQMPGFSFRHTGDHSNALVPLWAKGAGSEQFARRVRGTDVNYAKYVGWNDGQYVDNTDVAAVVMAALRGEPVEQP